MDKEFLPGRCRLDLLVLTHPHHDHLKGLNSVLGRCQVKSVVFYEIEYKLREYERWLENIEGSVF